MDLDLVGIHVLDVAMWAVDGKYCTVVAGIVDICLCVVKTTANVVFVLEVFAVVGLVVIATDVGFVLDVVGIFAVVVLAVVVVVVGTNVVTVVLFVVGTTVDVGGTVIFVVGFPVTTVDVGGTVLFGVGFVVIIFFVVVVTEIRDKACFMGKTMNIHL